MGLRDMGGVKGHDMRLQGIVGLKDMGGVKGHRYIPKVN